MSELKSYSVVASSEAHNYINGEINLAFEAYDADDVDALLAKKDAEIAELKQKLEDAKATAYTESVDVGMENHKLKRALWLARAERANESHFMWCQFIYDKKFGIVKFNVRKEWGENVKQGQTSHTPQGWADVWEEVERKCLKKAEEYK